MSPIERRQTTSKKVKRRPVNVAIAGMDGIGKSTILLELKTALKNLDVNARIIDAPHYSEFQGYSFFRWVSRTSKELIDKGTRGKSKITILLGSAIASLPFGIAKSITRNTDIRLIKRHPLIEAGAIFEIYGKRRLSRVAPRVARVVSGKPPQIIIFMTGSPKTAAMRIAADVKRDAKWGETRFPHETVEKLAELDSAYRKTISSLKKTYGDKIAIFEIDGTQPFKETVQEIVKRLKELKVI